MRREHDGPATGQRLGLDHDEATALLPLQRLTDRQCPGVEVECVPWQADARGSLTDGSRRTGSSGVRGVLRLVRLEVGAVGTGCGRDVGSTADAAPGR